MYELLGPVQLVWMLIHPSRNSDHQLSLVMLSSCFDKKLILNNSILRFIRSDKISTEKATVLAATGV